MHAVLCCRCADREARLFFHFSEARFSKAALVEGAEVSFQTVEDGADGRPMARVLQLLPPGTIAASFEEELPGAPLPDHIVASSKHMLMYMLWLMWVLWDVQ